MSAASNVDVQLPNTVRRWRRREPQFVSINEKLLHSRLFNAGAKCNSFALAPSRRCNRLMPVQLAR